MRLERSPMKQPRAYKPTGAVPVRRFTESRSGSSRTIPSDWTFVLWV